MIRLLLADDHKMFLDVLISLLGRDPGLAVVATAEDWPRAIERARDVCADVMVLDLSMPGGDGIESIREIRKLRPEVPILVLTMHHEERYAQRAMEAGARGYLTKDAAVHQLAAAVRRLAEGGRSIDPAVAQRLAIAYAHRSRPAEESLENLSPQETRIFEFLVHGKSGAQIAKELSVSHQTVSTHKTRILVKLNLNNQAELVRYAAERHLFGL